MPTRNVIEINDLNFASAVEASPLPVLIDFGAVWCAPCRAIAPHLDAVAAAYSGRIRVGACDVDANPALAARFEVRSMPTLLLLRGREVVGQIVGAVPRAKIEALVERALG